MIKTLISVILFISIFSCQIFARNLDKNILINIYGATGYSYSEGTFNQNYNSESAYNYEFAGGISAAWAPYSFGAIAFTTEYSSKKLSTDYTYNGADYTETKEIQFINFMLGWKGFVSYLYYEAGIMYGLPFGTWDNSAEADGSSTVPALGPDGKIDNDYINPEYGAYFGMGGIYWFNDSIAVEAGFQFQGAFNDCYKNTDNPEDNKLRSRAVLLKVGATYCL